MVRMRQLQGAGRRRRDPCRNDAGVCELCRGGFLCVSIHTQTAEDAAATAECDREAVLDRVQLSRTARSSLKRGIPRRSRRMIKNLFAALRMGLHDGFQKLHSSTSELVHAGAECAAVSKIWSEGIVRAGCLCGPGCGVGRVTGMAAIAVDVESETG